MIDCPVCNTSVSETIEAECFPADQPLLGEKHIIRYICNYCGLIFGPMSFINLSKKELAYKYDEIYKVHTDVYTTVDYHNFFHLNPSKELNYLNIACGTKPQYLQNIRNDGYKVYTNEILLENEYNFKNLDDCPVKTFSGIFSNNYIEHIQHPLEWFSELHRRLEPNGIMVHATGCFNYVIERTPFHLYFWNRKALDIICEKTGFVLEPIIKYHVPAYLCRSLRLDEIPTTSYNGEPLGAEDGVRLIFRKI